MRALLLLGCIGMAGCTSSELVRTAQQETPDVFRQRLPGLLAEWTVDEGDAREVAQLVAAREVTGAVGNAGARALEAIAPCTADVDESLDLRSQRGDDHAARAALLRLEADLSTPENVGTLLADEAPGWRALAARTLTMATPSDRPLDGEAAADARGAAWRRKLFTDPTAQVRTQALRAAQVATDPGDLDELLRVARLDPVPRLRAMAIEVIGELPATGAARSLWDVWVAADEVDRVAIVHAWARLAPRDEDAARALLRATDGTPDLPLVAACLAIIGDHEPPEAPGNVVTASQVLARAIASGSPRSRAAGIEGAPLSWSELREAVTKAVDDADPVVAATAAARLLDAPQTSAIGTAKALTRLRRIAVGPGPGAELARGALVTARDRAAVAVVERDARAASAVDRARAAKAWVALGELRRAVMMLGDTDAAVRATAACALLRGPDAGG